jgi:hypothetical protein
MSTPIFIHMQGLIRGGTNVADAPQRQSEGAAKWARELIIQITTNFLRSTNVKTLDRTEGNSMNNCDYFKFVIFLGSASVITGFGRRKTKLSYCTYILRTSPVLSRRSLLGVYRRQTDSSDVSPYRMVDVFLQNHRTYL